MTNSDVALAELAEKLAERLGGREVTLSFVMGDMSFWRATVLPTDETIARRLQIARNQLTESLVFAYEDQPIAIGDGATRGEALANVKPVPWPALK